MNNFDKLFILLNIISTALAHKEVTHLPPYLSQQGFYDYIELGEVVAEQVVDSPAACGQLCQANPACSSIMMMGTLCRMYGQKIISPVSIIFYNVINVIQVNDNYP